MQISHWRDICRSSIVILIRVKVLYATWDLDIQSLCSPTLYNRLRVSSSELLVTNWPIWCGSHWSALCSHKVMRMWDSSYSRFVNLVVMISLFGRVLLQHWNMILNFNESWSINLNSPPPIIWGCHCIKLILSNQSCLSSYYTFEKLGIDVSLNEIFELIGWFWPQFGKNSLSLTIRVRSFMNLFPAHSFLNFLIMQTHNILHLLNVVNSLRI